VKCSEVNKVLDYVLKVCLRTHRGVQRDNASWRCLNSTLCDGIQGSIPEGISPSEACAPACEELTWFWLE